MERTSPSQPPPSSPPAPPSPPVSTSSRLDEAMFHRDYLAPALLLLLFLCLAPAMGEVRDLVFRLFSKNAVGLLAGGSAVLAAAIGVWAFLRIRSRRRLRYGALIVAAALLWLQVVGFSTGQVRTDVVEKVHIFQYGLIGFLICRARRLEHPAAVLWIIAVTAVAGTLEECVQWFVPRRTGELRDVWINLAAGWTGMVFSLAWRPPERWTPRSSAAAWRQARRAAAVAVFLLGGFIYVAHLGYLVEDPRIGRFRSWHTAEQLLELSQKRAAEWTAQPPRKLPIWDKEDYYLTEAAWHANHRNAARNAGDHVSAWHAHRILEIYYAPFLDLPRFRGSGVHRYPQKERRKLRRQAGKPDLSGRISPVLEQRVWTSPTKRTWTIGWLCVVAALWGRRRPEKPPREDSESSEKLE